jgi:hypothetical protein
MAPVADGRWEWFEASALFGALRLGALQILRECQILVKAA